MKRYEVLAGIIKRNGWTKGAEIGVFKGDTFFYLLEKCPDLKLIGVDQWLSGEPHERNLQKGLSTWWPQSVMDQHASKVKKGVERFKNGRIIHKPSLEAVKEIEDKSLDFVFIDAEHTTEAVLKDVFAWSPKVRLGGGILGHDENWPSVKLALKQMFPWKVHDGNIWEAQW